MNAARSAYSFPFVSVPRILFGIGEIAKLPEVCRPLGQRALLVYNGPANRPTELLGNLLAANYNQRGEPAISDVDAALATARQHRCDLVIGFGGGSAIDCAKAVAALLTNGGAPLDYMEVIGAGRKIEKPAAPFIAIPTTAGTGAEATRNAVISAPEHRFKASLRSDHLLARVAIVDPQLGVDVSAHITARSGADALCQCIESYTSRQANPISDALALQGIQLATRPLLTAVQKPGDLFARHDMALAALLSGICLTNVGLGAVHGFAAPLGALYPIPHGVICGLLLPHVLAANIAALQSHPLDPKFLKYQSLAHTLTGEARAPADAAIPVIATLIRQLKLPSLSSFGVSPTDISYICSLAKKSSSMRYNPVELSDTALYQILENALTP